jgi:hypothetical protein
MPVGSHNRGFHHKKNAIAVLKKSKLSLALTAEV